MDLRLVIELATDEDVAREWSTHLSQGGAFARDATAPCNQACVIVLLDRHGRELELAGRTVWSGDGGVGVQLDGFDRVLRERIDAWLQAPPPADAPADAPAEASADEDDEHRDPIARNVYERMRNLPIAQQLRAAREGELAERIALERLYGKTVWEALLRNPRITPPEVARLARMGQLPRPLLEVIAGTTAWLRAPEVRRALLANLKLTADLAAKVLRLLPKHELKLVPTQTAYPSAVRDAARRLLRDT
jgi:hypothetical protein